jgi:hypothetical protein
VDYTQVDGIIDIESNDNSDKVDSQAIFPSGVESNWKWFQTCQQENNHPQE